MKRLHIQDMSDAQLGNVYDNNEKLRSDVYDDAVESESMWIGEHLDAMKPGLADWRIGLGERNYLVVRSPESFIKALRNAQSMYGTLADKDAPLLDEAEELLEQYWSEEVGSKLYCVLEGRVERIAERLADMVVMTFVSALEWHTEKTSREYFIDFYAEERLGGDEYVEFDENMDTDWKLKKDVVKTF